MTTFTSIVNEVHLRLSGYTQRQDAASSLATSITASALTFTVADGTVLSRGLVEIDDELIWVASFDRVTATATVPAYGRGFRGTTATSHNAGVRVTVAPTFPRATIATSINDAIEGLYPDLFAVSDTTFTYVAARSTYALPSNVVDAQQVSWQTIGPSLEWLPIRKYRVDTMANTATWPTGRTISLYDSPIPGRTVQVTYTHPASTLDYGTDDFADTGLPASAKEVVVLGAAYRMASYLDAGRVPAQSVEADAMQPNNPVGSGGQVSRLLFGMYSQRLQTEIRRQQEQFQARIRFTR